MWYNKLVAAGYAVVAEGAFTDGLQYRIDFAGCMVGRGSNGKRPDLTAGPVLTKGRVIMRGLTLWVVLVVLAVRTIYGTTIKLDVPVKTNPPVWTICADCDGDAGRVG